MKRYFYIIIIICCIIPVCFIKNTKVNKDIYIEKKNMTNVEKVIFTSKEKQWIKEHRNKDICVGVAEDYIPIEYVDKDGEPKGVGVEIIKRVNKLTGLRFKLYKNKNKEDWKGILQNTFDGKIDVLPSVSFTKKRSKYLDFSNQYIEMTQVIVGHKDNSKLISKFDQIKHGTFAVPKGYWISEIILDKNPNAKIVEVKSMKEALDYISIKKADYTICEIPVFTYYNEQDTYNNIKIVGELKDKNKILIGVRKEYSDLVPIINKIINSANHNELYESALVMPSNDLKEKKLIFLVVILTIILLVVVYYLYKTFKKLLIAKKEAEKANVEKTSLMANIAHDLRTPITVIIGYTQAISDGNVKSEKDKQRYIKRICERTKYLSDIVDDFFLLSRVEDGTIVLTKDNVNINLFVENVVESLYFKAESKNIKILTYLDWQADVYREIDILKLRRVIENIIINAIKYSMENGIVEIRTRIKEDKVEISIKDNGIGIASEDIPHLFERYYKGKNAKKESIGLGLYIAKKIINKHNGEIWAESQLGKGSIFYVLI